MMLTQSTITVFIRKNHRYPVNILRNRQRREHRLPKNMALRIREFTAEEYIELLGTYSDHIAIDEPIRKKFFSEIEQAIKEHGGVIKIFDTMDLQLARKRGVTK